MTPTVYILDTDKNEYVDLEVFVAAIDEKRRTQLLRLAHKLRAEQKLEGPTINFDGDNVWKVNIVNEKNSYECFLLRLGEEVIRRMPNFRDTYRGLETLAALNVRVKVAIHPHFHRFNPLDFSTYNTEAHYTLKGYFEVYNFRAQEIEEVTDAINRYFLGEEVLGIHEFTPVSFLLHIELKTERIACFHFRVV